MATAGAEAPASAVVSPVEATPSVAGAWPDFAVVCSFLERYGALLDLPELTFPELEVALEETGAVPKPLMELHLKLMRKIGKSVTVERWEKYMIKICQDYNSTWAWEMEEKGYQEMSVECKVGLLKHLCECQFDDNLKFKNIINEEDGDAMRLQPIGRDKDGLMYWFQLDQEHNIRMYIEEQDDQDGSTWKCIVKSRNDLAETLELLKAQIDPALLKKNEPEESSSQEGLNPEGEDIKPENQETAKDNGHLKDEKPEGEDGLEKLKTTCEDEGQANSLKMEEEPLKTASEIKTEPASEENQIAKEECDSYKENVKPLSPELKEEKEKPKDVKDSKGSCDQVTPPREPERTEVSVIVKRTEDPVEKSTEDTEKIKNDQQAKIPLKKRELKLTDDFDSPVKATLNKPKEALLKDGKKEDEHIKNALSLVLEGKQLVNGEINNEKTTYKGKLDLVEENSSDIKEKDDSSLKEENGILHEKQSTGVIKSLSDVIECNKSLGTDKSELPVKSLVNDVSSPSAEKLKQKSLSGEGHDGASLKTVSINDEDLKKKAMASPSIVDKQVIEKEADNVDSSTKCSTESSLSNKTATVCLDESNTTSDVPQNLTEECNSENKTDQNLCKSDLKNQTGDKEDSEVQSKLSVPVKTTKLRPSRKAARKNSAKNRERDNATSLQKSSKELIKSDTTEAAENEKSSETDKNNSSKSKHKNKSTSKESKEAGTDSVVTESQLIEDGKVDGTPTTEVETSKSEPKTPVLKSKPKSKQISEDENSETEGKEMTSERQKDGLKLTIRISSKRRRGEALLLASMAREAEEAEVEESIGRNLRRSPRISRPTAKVAEIREQKPEKKQSDEEEKPVEQKPEKDEEIKPEKDPCSKLKRNKPRQRRRARWTIFRSRRKRKESSEEESEESDSEGDSEVGSEEEGNKEGVPGEDDEPCKKCGLPNHPELILLCDSCDSGYHTACLRPPLMIIPDGEWFCPPCQHKVLCEKLEEQLQNLDVVLKKKERAVRRKERLVYVGISIENIIPTQEVEEVPEVQEKEEKKKKKPKPLERRSTRTRKCISYRFDEFDEAIDEAIEDDIRDGDGGGGGGRGKDMSNITGHRGKDISTILEGEKIETKRPQRTVSRRKKRRRLNDLDSDSKEEEESEDDEFKISEGSQDEFVVSNEDVEESEEDQQSNDSDFGVRRPRRHYRRPVRKSRRLKRRKRKYSDDDEEEDSEEEEQEESETDASSDYSDDYLDMRRRRSRRNQKRQVNYKEDSESDGSQKGARYGRGKEMRRILKRRFSSSESNESGTEKKRPGRGRPPLLRKRIRSSNDECSEDEKPVRKRLNRIETDEDEEDTKVCEVEKPPTVDKPSATINLQESTKKPCYRIESDDDDFDNVGKDESPLDYSLVDLPSTNGQSPGKTIENLIGKPSDKSQTSKDTSANISQASNGTGSNPEAVVPEEDEDELLRVTDLVDYVCNSEQL